jgi:hypothetical protein
MLMEAEHPEDASSSLTFSTMFLPGVDLLTPDLMLEHQIHASMADSRHVKRVVLELPPWAPSASIKNAVVIPLQPDVMVRNESFFREFADNLGLQSLDDLILKNSQGDPNRDQHNAWNAVGMMRFLEQCQTTYCAWLDPDIFVYREADGEGWVDAAIRLLEQTHFAVAIGPSIGDEPGQACRLMPSDGGTWSSRYFVVHKPRLFAKFPLTLRTCGGGCGTFESFFELPSNSVAGLACGRSAWVIHPPDDKEMLLQLIQGCSRQKERRARSFLSTRQNSTVAQDGVEHLWQRVQQLGTEALMMSRRHIQEATENDYENMPSSLNGWECRMV